MIEGVLPAVAVDRTAPVRTSRSTVSTITSIADYLRALFARAARVGRKVAVAVVREAFAGDIISSFR